MSYEIKVLDGPYIEQDWQNETTRSWFRVEKDGELEEYCIADCNGDTEVLDTDGAPITEGDHLTVYLRKALEPLYHEAKEE